jgi:transposase InsO family protein
VIDLQQNEDPSQVRSPAPGAKGEGLNAPPSPPPPAPLPIRREEVEELDPDEEVVILDEEPLEPLPPICGEGEAGSGPRMSGKRRNPPSKAARLPGEERPRNFTSTQRLLILDSWQRSALPATDFAPLVGLSPAALYKWKRLFEEHGPSGLEEKRRGAPAGSKLSEVTKRTILLLKKAHPDWGQDRIHNELQRSAGLAASATAIGKVLNEAGYVVEDRPTRPHGVEPKRFERAVPGKLWQTDIFTFRMARQNRNVHLVGFMDDNSRYVVGYGLHATASGALVREVFEAAIAAYGAPEEALTDNGPQYVTWRGKSGFSKQCDRRGVKHVVARPRRPQTLGKIERFWATLWNECLAGAVFVDLEEARIRIGLFVDHYNFHRTHQGIDGCVPADRFFLAAPEVKATLAARVAKNALELAKQGVPRKPFYLTGRVGDVGISLHAEGEKVVLTRGDGARETVDLRASGRRAEEPGEQTLPVPVAVTVTGPFLPGADDDAELLAPGQSRLDGALEAVDEGLADDRPVGDHDLITGSDDTEVTS